MTEFKELLTKYAHLLIEKGLNVQTGETVGITIASDQYELGRLLTKVAYERGAAEVIVSYTDDVISHQTFLYGEKERVTQPATYELEKMRYLLEKRASRLSVVSSDPDALKGVSHDVLSEAMKNRGKAFKPMSQAVQSNEISWTVAAAAGEKWAQKVFPDLPSDQAVDRLWQEIFKTCRIYTEDPIKAWDEHEHNLVTKADILNDTQFDGLHYVAPGTDFKVGLPKNHVWEAAGSTSRQGVRFIANMPTEEVFTAPDHRRAEGYISSTRPLSYSGNIIEGMHFTFKDGKVVDVTADKGEETIRRLVFETKGANGLGEVALVSDPSPISQSGIVFFNTLFDENASNHLALGSAYATSVVGGADLTDDELEEVGLNRSDAHVDFMVGSSKMDVYGITKDGKEVPIFKQGDWAI